MCAAIHALMGPTLLHSWPRTMLCHAVAYGLLASLWGGELLASAHLLSPPPSPGSPLPPAIQAVLSHSAQVMRVLNATGVPTLSTVFNNTYTFTAAETWQDFPDGTVFIDTGDIQQQWLRDSCNQMRPYLPLVASSAPVATVFVKSLQRMTRFYISDRYASAFNPYAQPQYDQCPKSLDCLNCTCLNCRPSCGLHSYQHAYEPDSFCWVVDMAYRFWELAPKGRSVAALDGGFAHALRVWLSQLQDESDHVNRSPYSCGATCGVPKPTARVGLLWGAARPSDDSQAYNYNIPDNMFATVALEQAVCPCLQRSYPPACLSEK